MRSSIPSIRLLLCCVIGIMMLVGAARVYADDRMGRLQEFEYRLDSLEVEKQRLKRRGLPLAALEAQTSVMRDSIEEVRTFLGDRSPAAESAPATSASRNALFEVIDFFRTASVFDWILIGAGMVAVLSACVLLLVFLRTIFRRRRLPPPVHADAKRAMAGYGQARVTVPTVPGKEPMVADPPPPIENPPRSESGGGAEKLAEQVLAASRSGADSREIARRFHIGVDQVSLIIRFAGKK